MDAAEKGQRYAKLFRRAGNFLSKGNVARAIEVLKDGQALAEQLGDASMARRYADEIERVGSPPLTE
ncbi:MAG TPA: hypothetical protein VMF50_03515 [Candidatus Binataceae bacterium]|nr:hypothetical protein [Candidatus Binataceae bacterium]